jgi:hypothetical protein
MALGDLNPQAISPGRQRLADEAEQKLASGALDLNSP